jgi:hypothetical protein
VALTAAASSGSEGALQGRDLALRCGEGVAEVILRGGETEGRRDRGEERQRGGGVRVEGLV